MTNQDYTKLEYIKNWLLSSSLAKVPVVLIYFFFNFPVFFSFLSGVECSKVLCFAEVLLDFSELACNARSKSYILFSGLNSYNFSNKRYALEAITFFVLILCSNGALSLNLHVVVLWVSLTISGTAKTIKTFKTWSLSSSLCLAKVPTVLMHTNFPFAFYFFTSWCFRPYFFLFSCCTYLNLGNKRQWYMNR